MSKILQKSSGGSLSGGCSVFNLPPQTRTLFLQRAPVLPLLLPDLLGVAASEPSQSQTFDEEHQEWRRPCNQTNSIALSTPQSSTRIKCPGSTVNRLELSTTVRQSSKMKLINWSIVFSNSKFFSGWVCNVGSCIYQVSHAVHHVQSFVLHIAIPKRSFPL